MLDIDPGTTALLDGAVALREFGVVTVTCNDVLTVEYVAVVWVLCVARIDPDLLNALVVIAVSVAFPCCDVVNALAVVRTLDVAILDFELIGSERTVVAACREVLFVMYVVVAKL